MKRLFLIMLILLTLKPLSMLCFVPKNLDLAQKTNDVIEFVNKGVELCKEKGALGAFDLIRETPYPHWINSKCSDYLGYL